ncbi:MAG: glycosyltransferase [Armatimonadota bacterium]|nr:glycosyltransferase [Armatimonadota bacterium]
MSVTPGHRRRPAVSARAPDTPGHPGAVAYTERAAGPPAPAAELDASIVVSTYNCRDQLAALLADLAAQEGAFEIVVVDDGSTDGTAEMLDGLAHPHPVRVLRQRNQGLAVARNRAARVARGRVLLFLDPDLRLAPGLVAAHLRHYRGGALLAVQGRTVQDPATLQSTFMRAYYLLPDLAPRRRDDLSYAHVAARNFSVAREAFAAVGGFDETFRGYGFEDLDLAYRLKRAGVRIVYEPAAVVRHVHVLDLAAVMRRQREAGRNAVYLWRKHGRPHSLALLAEIHPVLLPLKWLVYRTGVGARVVRAVLPWAERHQLLPLCSECYNHLIWRAYYQGVAEGLREGPRAGGR